MSTPDRRRAAVGIASSIIHSPGFGRAITLSIVMVACASFLLRTLIGWPGLVGAVLVLTVLAAGALVLRRDELEWRGLLPISLLLFVLWSAVSLVWTEHQWATLGSSLYQLAIAFLGLYVALTRDFIQIVRAFGDVLRVVLTASVAVEVLAGILLDMPFPFLGVTGRLAAGGPIEGVFGTRNLLGFVALIALVTFFVESRTRSVSKAVVTWSLVLGAGVVLLTRSPVAIGTAAAVVVASAALLALRRTDPATRRVRQVVLVATIVVAATLAVAARGRVIAILNAGSEFEFRDRLWRRVVRLTEVNPLEGFGWLGYWRGDLPPYSVIDPFAPPHQSALNAYLDVWLQLGLVGLLAFIALIGLALVRSWLLASNKRSVVYVWPALVLVSLAIVSAAESFALAEFGWFTLVVCAVRASHELSWRSRLPQH